MISNFTVLININKLTKSIETIYFKILLFSPFILLISWIIPMLGAYICYSFMLLFNTYEDKVFYNDNKYRLSFDEGFLLHDYELKIYKKDFIFERKVKAFLLNEMNFDEITKVEELNQSKLKIEFREIDKQKICDTIISIKK